MDQENGKNFSFFAHKECEYYPCHKGVEEEDFNCLFCFCPLYVLGEKCGGSPHFLENGIKDCSYCNFPHQRKNYNAVKGRFQELATIAGRIHNSVLTSEQTI